MVLNLVRNEGVPALAYPVNDESVPSSCCLKILHSDAHFVVSLGHSISTHGVDDEQLVTFRYEGDNLIPGKNSLEDVGIPLPRESLDIIARHGQPRLRTLSLTLKAPCSIWYPHNFGYGLSILHADFHALLTLARATEIRILFDTNWLGKSNLARLQSALQSSRQLTGVPVIPEFVRLYQQADWSILNLALDAKYGAYPPIGDLVSEAVPSIEDAVAGAPRCIEDTVHDAPPSYAHVSQKRPRINTRTSLTPDSPLPKRLLRDLTCAPSPTERAKSIVSSSSTVQVDLFQDSVTSAVEKVLPDMLREQLPGILKDVLLEMLVSPSPSPSLSPTPRSSQIENALTQQRRNSGLNLTPAASMRAIISQSTKTHLQKIFDKTIDEASNQASELYMSANIEFEEWLDDAKIDLTMLKEDHLTTFNDDCNEKLDEFKERLVEQKDEVEFELNVNADEVVRIARDRLNVVKHGARCCFRCQCLNVEKDNQSRVIQSRRAMSLP